MHIVRLYVEKGANHDLHCQRIANGVQLSGGLQKHVIFISNWDKAGTRHCTRSSPQTLALPTQFHRHSAIGMRSLIQTLFKFLNKSSNTHLRETRRQQQHAPPPSSVAAAAAGNGAAARRRRCPGPLPSPCTTLVVITVITITVFVAIIVIAVVVVMVVVPGRCAAALGFATAACGCASAPGRSQQRRRRGAAQRAFAKINKPVDHGEHLLAGLRVREMRRRFSDVVEVVDIAVRFKWDKFVQQ